MSSCEEHDDLGDCGWCEANALYDQWKRASTEYGELKEAVDWVLTDAAYKAPEQRTPESDIWIARLERAVSGRQSDG